MARGQQVKQGEENFLEIPAWAEKREAPHLTSEGTVRNPSEGNGKAGQKFVITFVILNTGKEEIEKHHYPSQAIAKKSYNPLPRKVE